MIASLTWIDHNERERDRMRRILALFRERDTRDELGIGAIRFRMGFLVGTPFDWRDAKKKEARRRAGL